MSQSRTSFTRRLQQLPLAAKLAWLSGGLTAIIVLATFIGLILRARDVARTVVGGELEQSQHTLAQLEDARLEDLKFGSKLVANAPTIIAALSTEGGERTQGVLTPAARRRYAATVENVLRDMLPQLQKELAIVTDDSGVVLAATGRTADAALKAANLSRMPAVRHALDPRLPADSGELGVLQTGTGNFQVAVFPLVIGGATSGTVLLGEGLDSVFVSAVRGPTTGSGGADLVITAGRKIIARSNSSFDDALADSLDRLRAMNGRRTLHWRGGENVVAPVDLGRTQTGDPVSLWLVRPVSPLVRALTGPIGLDFLVYGVVAVLLAGFGAALVARSILTPLERFVAYLRSRRAAERTSAFDDSDAPPEVRTLSGSFSELMVSLESERQQLERRTTELTAANSGLREEVRERKRVEQALRESEIQLRQSQKLEAIGTLAGGVAHDFNNLLTVISGYTQLAQMRAKGTPIADDLQHAVDAAQAAANLTHQLLAFSRKQVLQPTVLQVNEVVGGMAAMIRRLIGEHIELEIGLVSALPHVRVDRGQLEQVVLNLVVNARDAMPNGGRLRILSELVPERTRPDGRVAPLSVALVVRDTGTGIADDVRDRVFEPFFTTKEVGKGTGLGLSMVYGIVKQSGGTIDLETKIGAGTTFRVVLPAFDDARAALEEAMSDAVIPDGTETVLVVEDEDEVRTLARRALEERGYTVIVAGNAAEALDVINQAQVDLIVSDVVMPQTSGPELVAQLTAMGRRPRAVMYMSGYAEDSLANFAVEPGSEFLRKPFTPGGLARAVRDALDAGVDRAATV